jgi:hypothetical protein
LTDHDKNDDRNVAAKKAEYAIAAVSNTDYQKDPACIKANLQYLGMASLQHESLDIQKAIPPLIALLGYHVEPRPGHAPTRFDEYPAITALYQIGQPAVPALLEVLAAKESESVESKNALDAFMDSHRQDLDVGLKKLKQAAQKETDSARAGRLERTVHNARDRWCRYTSCKE